jgi:DeoR/GlpR family transcriptional regulator of sugar metabolism
MSNVQTMENLDKLEKLLQQNLHGIKITDVAKKLNVDRSTVYKYLYSLDLQGKAHYERGIAYPGKPSTEKPSKFGFFELLDKRAERKRQEQKEEEKRQLLESIHFRELLAEVGGEEWAIMKKIAEKDREILKELDREDS